MPEECYRCPFFELGGAPHREDEDCPACDVKLIYDVERTLDQLSYAIYA